MDASCFNRKKKYRGLSPDKMRLQSHPGADGGNSTSIVETMSQPFTNVTHCVK